MGLKTGSTICQCVTDVIHQVIQFKGTDVYNYLDVIICMHKIDNADTEFKMLYSLFDFRAFYQPPKSGTSHQSHDVHGNIDRDQCWENV